MTKEKPVKKCGPRTDDHFGTGYTIEPDGRISLAPHDFELIDAIAAERAALRELCENTNKFAAAAFTLLQKRERQWWANIKANLTEDWGDGRWSYDPLERAIRPVAPAPTPDEAERTAPRHQGAMA